MWLDRAGVLHVHSRYSDGYNSISRIAKAAQRAGLDFVVVTDHDTLAGRDNGEQGWYGDTLVLVGQEISPDDGNHFLALGLSETVPGGPAPQVYVDAVRAAGGLGFIAHPDYPEPKRYPLQTFPWNDWTVHGYTGVEIWNYTVDWLTDVTNVARLVPALLHPDRSVNGPFPETLVRWDRLCERAWASGRRFVGIAGADAHGILYSYRRMFKTVRIHVLLAAEWSGDIATDEAMILEALRQGRTYAAYDELHDATGFKFCAERGSEQVPMGGVPGSARGGRPVWLVVKAPRTCRLTLRSTSGVVSEVDASHLRERVPGPGVYRVEARLPGQRGLRPWVFTNPIYVR